MITRQQIEISKTSEHHYLEASINSTDKQDIVYIQKKINEAIAYVTNTPQKLKPLEKKE
jgi:hypothetical protein